MSVHSDAEMQIASLIAYLDIPAGTSLGRYMDTHANDETVQRIREIAEDCTGDSHGYDNWRIVGVGDDQNASGMYGCMIDDGRGDAIIAFRGSEGDQILEDWGGADFGLLNNTETWQQAQAEEFTRRMYEEFGDQYDSYAFTGHSLGGNLAIDAAIDAPPGMRDRISQVVGLDSPGFSDDYWATHADGIREMEGRISHYQWSGVGAIFETPGTERTVNVRDMGNCVSRHDLRNLDTGTGSVSDRPGGMTADEIAIKTTAAAFEYTGPFNPFGPGIIISGITGLIDIWNRVTSIGQHMQVSTAATTESKARFDINTTSILTLEERYGEVEANLRQAESALSDIETRLKYHSSVSWLVKYKIRNESTRVLSLAETMKKYREVLRNSVTNYQQADAAATAAYGVSVPSGGTSSPGNTTGAGTSTTGGNTSNNILYNGNDVHTTVANTSSSYYDRYRVASSSANGGDLECPGYVAGRISERYGRDINFNIVNGRYMCRENRHLGNYIDGFPNGVENYDILNLHTPAVVSTEPYGVNILQDPTTGEIYECGHTYVIEQVLNVDGQTYVYYTEGNAGPTNGELLCVTYDQLCNDPYHRPMEMLEIG